MEQWKKNTYVLWFAVFMSAICWTMVMPFMPVYLTSRGVTQNTEFWSGVIIAASAFCNMVMSPIWGALGDRYGRRLMMLRAGFFLVLGYVLLALSTNLTMILVVRMMIGALTGFVPMAVALVGVSTPQHAVGKALGIVQTSFPAGAIIGPVVGGFLADKVGVDGSSWVAAVVIGLATLLVMASVREEFSAPPVGKQNILQDVKVATGNPVLMSLAIISCLNTITFMALEPVFVPFVHLLAGPNSPEWLAGVLFSIPGAALILTVPYWANRGSRVGYANTVAVGLLGSAVLFGLQTFVTSPWQLGALRLAAGVTTAAITPGVAALLATAIPVSLRGRAFGLNQAFSSLGSIVGPLVGGYLGSYVSPRAVFVLGALIFVVGYFWVKRSVQPRVQAALAGD